MHRGLIHELGVPHRIKDSRKQPYSIKGANNMTKTQIKKEFKNAGVQIGGGAMDSIEYELVCFVRRMANRCAEGNLKRLTPELMWCALGRNK